MSTKQDLAALLEESEGQFLSGSLIAEKLGITRAAVWKNIRLLQSDGYEIEAVTTEETIATARLRITAPDAVVLVTQAVSGMDSLDEALLTQNMEQLLSGSFATVAFSVEVQLVQVEGTWCLVPNDQWSDAITGGLISRYAQLQLAILEALAGGADQ